jgi:hypothetical protein
MIFILGIFFGVVISILWDLIKDIDWCDCDDDNLFD